MWGSFRGLKDQVESVSKNVTKPGGVSTFISRIGEAVAPTTGNSYDEESEDNEYYEEDEDYYEEGEEEDGDYEEDEETMEYFLEEEGESNSFNNQLSAVDNDEDGESHPKKLPPPEAFSSLIARAFDQLEEEENYNVIDDDTNYIITESLTANDDDGLSQEDAALEQISKNIRTEIEITSANGEIVATLPSEEGPPEITGVRPAREEKDSPVKNSGNNYLTDDISHGTETYTDPSHSSMSKPLQGDTSELQNSHFDITDQNLRSEKILTSQENCGVSSVVEPDCMKEELFSNENVFKSNNVEPNLRILDEKTQQSSLCSNNLQQEYETTKSAEKLDLSNTSSTNPEFECKHDANTEAADQGAVHSTTVAEDYDDLNNSLLNDEDQDVSDTSLDRPAILAQSINYIRQLEENLNKEKSLSSALQAELTNLKNQFECHKQQTDDRFRQQGQVLKQYSEETKILNKEKARLEVLLKERQAQHEEENQKHQMQYQRLLEESKRSLSQDEQKLEEKSGEIQQLQKVISDMRSNMRATAERAREAEEIIKELNFERDELEKELHEELDIKAALEEELEEIKRATGKVGGLQMELKLLKEETDREKEKNLSAAEAARNNLSEVVSQRDAAKQEARDLERQLAATLADLELSRKDYERAILSNENLQSALESFQIEREAELSLLEEQRKHAEATLAAAHAAGIEAINEVNEARVKEVQLAADSAIRNLMEEIKVLEASVEKHRKEAVNLRRSLDEAIHRLQATQEDVVDRSLIKNMLLDWHARKGQSKREVLEVMSSLLHFTEDDKIKVGLGDTGHSTFGKVVEVVAAPLPKSVVDANKIEGDSVREKWVNFLLAETGDS